MAVNGAGQLVAIVQQQCDRSRRSVHAIGADQLDRGATRSLGGCTRMPATQLERQRELAERVTTVRADCPFRVRRRRPRAIRRRPAADLEPRLGSTKSPQRTRSAAGLQRSPRCRRWQNSSLPSAALDERGRETVRLRPGRPVGSAAAASGDKIAKPQAISDDANARGSRSLAR